MLFAIAIILLILLFFTIMYIGSQSSKKDNKITLDRLDEDPNADHHH